VFVGAAAVGEEPLPGLYPEGVLAAGYPTEGPDQGRIETREAPDPRAGAGAVRIRLAVSGVNPTDWKARPSGGLGADGATWVIPNQDGAGTIDAVGDGVDPARIGERVWVYNAQWQRANGTAAQWIALPTERAVRLPDHASLELGASLGIPAITAHRCLFARGELAAGAAVLVHGGAGAVGHAAIELARWRGLRVASTVSSEDKAVLAKAAGAELVVDYRTEDVAEVVRRWAPTGVQRVVEVDVGRNLQVDEAVLAPAGAISCYTAPSDPVALTRQLMVLNATLEFVLVYTMPESAKQAAVADITEALNEHALTTLPLHRFALGQAAEAHDAVEKGVVGKVLIDIP
jgi:NADPH2:quinone reductase